MYAGKKIGKKKERREGMNERRGKRV